MTAAQTVRERVRAELTKEIADIARRRLATEGAAGLSLRAVAREMGMASSAVYRYFPSRDDLLTRLIIDGYDALGEAVERAEVAVPRENHLERWLTSCRAIRAWALAHPHEYALLFGSPAPGYQAPPDTARARVRDVAVLGGIIADAYRAGAITLREGHVIPPPSLAGDAATHRVYMPDVPDEIVFHALASWTALYGWLNFEVFGHFSNTIGDRDTAFDHSIRITADLMGLSPL
ncbi:TetR/AcrR family transcriptional regulator [Sinosporangium siamense]|uniref:TetR family transcriptional regulator n=1 Tax=Sinosporangium siamense TaxID=1367973 RepID=A0A919RQB2_9ACTN|nr:TetR/AcrR family transcriptional regulator [Sinosporangium siamense]GII96476.1 TetR family transcriptional regulator [Sinosporangium siamense]